MVEQDSRVAYLYLHAPQHSNFGTRAVWIRNLIKGPLVLSDQEMQMGIPPVLPRTYCATPDGSPPLKTDKLRFVWFEEGNGVALLEDEDIIAVIPPWSGMESFHGYSRECRTENPICWPMPQQSHLEVRVRRAAQYWKNWEQLNPFKTYQEDFLGALAERWPELDRYFSIDGNKWPPKGVQCFKDGADLVAVTIGLGLCSMPNVELATENPSAIRRIELAMRIPSEADLESLLGWISGLANFPWHQFTWLGHGHTSSLPPGLLDGFEAVFFCHDQFSTQPIKAKPIQDDPVNLLWLVPVSASEADASQADERGSEALVGQLVKQSRV